jgi:hypothetical protein
MQTMILINSLLILTMAVILGVCEYRRKRGGKPHRSTTICSKCHAEFDDAMASCGTGSTWYLSKCPTCGQLYAIAYRGGSIPREVQSDPEIIIGERE